VIEFCSSTSEHEQKSHKQQHETLTVDCQSNQIETRKNHTSSKSEYSMAPKFQKGPDLKRFMVSSHSRERVMPERGKEEKRLMQKGNRAVELRGQR